MTTILRPYQQIGKDFLLNTNKAILADDVGLGKSVQALHALKVPALIAAPTYLTAQWYASVCEHNAAWSVSMPEGTRPQRETELARPQADVTIINIEMLRSYQFPRLPRTFVVDEAHHLNNPSTDQSKGAKRLAWKSEYTYLLTATPYYKRDDDIWHLLHMIDSPTFSSYWGFLREWCAVNWNAPYAPKIYGIKRARKSEWQKYMSSYMLMRTYADVGRQLPPLIEKVYTFDLQPTVRGLYDHARKKYRLLDLPITDSGTMLTALRDITMCPQKADIVRTIIEGIPTHEPVLVYTHYKHSAYKLATALAYLNPIVITGDTPPTGRVFDAKQHGLIIATLGALGEGVNLPHIRYVIYAEEEYVPGAHKQSVGRFQRDRDDIQDNTPVISYYVRARKTIDERIPIIRTQRHGSLAQLVKETLEQ